MLFRTTSSLLVVLLASSSLVVVSANDDPPIVCSVCGEGQRVTLPDAVFEFPGQPKVACGLLESVGLGGATIKESQCQYLPSLLTMCGCSSEEEETEAPTPFPTPPPTPVPETPVPETPVPETPVPETPVPETPVPETPVPETPVPETPVPETPVPETPVPETPVPETPVPETPVPETPVPEVANLQTAVPDTPVPETPVPETDVPVVVEDGDDDDDDDDEEEFELGEPTGDSPEEEEVVVEDLTDVEAVLRGGFYCGATVQDSETNCDAPCLTNADCSLEGEYCWGSWTFCTTKVPEATQTKTPNPLPTALQALSDYRCGVSEVDARSNCGNLCLTNDDCNNSSGEYCWATHTNYCHTMPEGHPRCDDVSKAEQVVRRCGFDEEGARSFCGDSCSDELDCAYGEHCFPVQLNLCDCFMEQDLFEEEFSVSPDNDRQRRQLQSNREYFDAAEAPLVPYFIRAYEEEQEQLALQSAQGSSAASSAAFISYQMVAVLFGMMILL